MSAINTAQIQPLPSPPQPGRPRRPFGLKALVVLLVLQALLSIAVGITLVLASSYLPADSGVRAQLFDVPGLSLITYSMLGASRFIVAIGLWRLRRWAWVWMMVQLAVSMVQDIQSYYGGQPLYPSMILNVIVVFYLNQHEVQDLFTLRQRQENV
ncbi:MAG: hypothetical protein KDE50_04865 [Caldilineaceae bacterium]|nr:hypothetical protein [Caldilineaceae bacterium]MCB0121171.1 hypothetical protein [Caldilineaceae bacterium]MCB0139221.1 hypothetical protein [Caldilineaceae bacterium]